MKYKVDEKGYALLMVLMLILLFTILGMGLFAMNMNASKQFNLKEEQVQARHQAEMGVMHYNALLQERFEKSYTKETTTVNLQCSDIESLLGLSKKLSFSNYEVRPGSPVEPSCKKNGNSSMEISIISKGTINGNTEKEVKATFFATALRPPSTPPKPPAVPEKADVWENIAQKKETNEIFGNLIVNNNISIAPGFEDIIKTHKDFYVFGEVNFTTHGCLVSAGNMTILGTINVGVSNTKILARKDIHLPSTINNFENGIYYIYGNVYLPESYTYGRNLNKQSFYVGGKVYQKTGQEYKEIINPFRPLTQKEMDLASSDKPCYTEPDWILLPSKNVAYQ